MNDENMVNEEVTEMEPVTEERSGMSTGTSMLLGGLLAIAAFAAGKKIKKVIDNRKAKRANEGPKVTDVEEETVYDVDETE